MSDFNAYANDEDVLNIDGDALTVDQLNSTGGPAPFHGTSAKSAAVTLNADGRLVFAAPWTDQPEPQ